MGTSYLKQVPWSSQQTIPDHHHYLSTTRGALDTFQKIKKKSRFKPHFSKLTPHFLQISPSFYQISTHFSHQKSKKPLFCRSQPGQSSRFTLPKITTNSIMGNADKVKLSVIRAPPGVYNPPSSYLLTDTQRHLCKIYWSTWATLDKEPVIFKLIRHLSDCSYL